MDDALRPHSPDAADIARRVNLHIAEMAENLDAIVPSERPLAFLCECGCLATVEATLADYRAAGGAWIARHRENLAA